MADCNIQQKHLSRSLLGRQPARAILIDASCPFNEDLCDIICESLENLFCLACNLAGPSRIPYVSIFLLTDVTECLLPLYYVKSNFTRIHNALIQLKKTVSDMGQLPSRDNISFITGIQNASEQYRRQQKTVCQVGTNFNQLEIIILSCQSPHFLQQQLESVVPSVELQHLKRIVCVTITLKSMVEALEGFDESPSSVESAHSVSSHLGELVDTVTLDADQLSLQNFFHGWLMDSGCDSEYLHVILPPAAPDFEDVVIKCDMQERLINPAQLPCSETFTLHPVSATCKSVFPSNSKAVGMTIPVHHLKITALIPSSSLCESVIFGMPMIVCATKCWKMDWDELEKNEQLFKALCYKLIKKDLVMLGQLEEQEISKPAPRRSKSLTLSPPSPQSYFVLLPAPNMTLLIKSIAVKELILPCALSGDMEEPCEENQNILQATMDKLEMLDSFNPLLHSSGLYEHLKFQTQKSNSLSTKPQKRKIEQTFSSKGYENRRSNLPHSNYTQTRTTANKLIITARQSANSFLTELE